jgi:hypothetical protein
MAQDLTARVSPCAPRDLIVRTYPV